MAHLRMLLKMDVRVQTGAEFDLLKNEIKSGFFSTSDDVQECKRNSDKCVWGRLKDEFEVALDKTPGIAHDFSRFIKKYRKTCTWGCIISEISNCAWVALAHAMVNSQECTKWFSKRWYWGGTLYVALEGASKIIFRTHLKLHKKLKRRLTVKLIIHLTVQSRVDLRVHQKVHLRVHFVIYIKMFKKVHLRLHLGCTCVCTCWCTHWCTKAHQVIYLIVDLMLQ